MKNIAIFGLFLFLLGSCDSELAPSIDEEEPISGIVVDTRLFVALVDQELQDRLNPDSPAYFGETYAEGIKLMYLYNGKKLTILEAWPHFSVGEYSDNFDEIFPPFRETADYGAISEGTYGYYFLNGTNGPILSDEDLISYMYIHYPDGKEDEIKVQLFKSKNRNLTLLRKVWINGELAYAMSENVVLFRLGLLPDTADRSDPDYFLDYYNPANFPFMEPVLDDDGNQIGNSVRPKYGTPLFFIRK